MKYKKSLAVFILICIVLGLAGCKNPVTDMTSINPFPIPENRVYTTQSVSYKPVITVSYAAQYAVVPYTEHVDSSVGSSLCVNNTTNELISGINPHEIIYPASITKIMTALLVLEKGDLNETVTINAPIELNDPMAVQIGLHVGDTITVNELMHGMLITSANDCAVALGRYIAGSDEAFVACMNQRAKELGATHTHFVNPHGLHSDNHYTTAYDLYLIFRELISHDEYRQIAGQANYTMQFTNNEGAKYSIPISNSNLFITQNYDTPEGLTVVCGKTGTTNEAGYCLIVNAVDEQNQNYIAVICNADSREQLYIQMQTLLSEINETETEK